MPHKQTNKKRTKTFCNIEPNLPSTSSSVSRRSSTPVGTVTTNVHLGDTGRSGSVDSRGEGENPSVHPGRLGGDPDVGDGTGVQQGERQTTTSLPCPSSASTPTWRLTPPFTLVSGEVPGRSSRQRGWSGSRPQGREVLFLPKLVPAVPRTGAADGVSLECSPTDGQNCKASRSGPPKLDEGLGRRGRTRPDVRPSPRREPTGTRDLG